MLFLSKKNINNNINVIRYINPNDNTDNTSSMLNNDSNGVLFGE